MENIEEIKTKLIAFRECDKFATYHDLHPTMQNSDEQQKKIVNDEMNRCCDELLEHLNSNQPEDDKAKQIVRDSLNRIEGAFIDTEEREFSYELYFKIGNMLGIDIQDNSKSMQEKLMDDIQKFIKDNNLNPDDFFPPKAQ